MSPHASPGGPAASAGNQELLELLPVAVCMIDAEARITFFNSAAAQLWGRRPELGAERWCGAHRLFRPDGAPMPPEECPMAVALREQRAHHGQEAMVERPDGSRRRFLAFPTPLFDKEERLVGAINMLVDITETKAAERAAREQTLRLETLNAVTQILSSDLDLDSVVQKATDAATELSGAKFGAYFTDSSGPDGEACELYALSGALREVFERFGQPRVTEIFAPTFRGAGVMRSDDIRADPRYGRNAPHRGTPKDHQPVVSYLAVPVISRTGAVLGGLFLGHDEKGKFTEETERLVAAIASHAAIAIDNARLLAAVQEELDQRRKAEAANRALLAEIPHRVKNTLATTQALAARSFPNADPAERAAFAERLRALGRAQDVLAERNWESAPVRRIVERVAAPFRNDDEPERFAISGEAATLDANRATLLAMALHELAMNAAKHGALRGAKGRVELTWEQRTDGGESRLALLWRERDGPAVAPPEKRGFGVSLLERGFLGIGSAEFDFDPAGVVCRLEIIL